MLRVLDLFSGIGGFSLGLERTGGFETVAFCEIEPFCQRVLAKHWPKVPIYDDVRELTGARLAADGIAVDVICGGFPCQDISTAGSGIGIEGERSGLWRDYARLIGELRPRYVFVENVAALLNRGLDRVLGDLAALGFDAEWHCIPACAVGAPHRRDRLWLAAYASGEFLRHKPGRSGGTRGAGPAVFGDDGPAWPMADAEGTGLEGWCFGRHARQAIARLGESGGSVGGYWVAEPDVGRVAHGVTSRVDRLRSLGNAVVPQIPELIGKAILEAEGTR
jgi:DNA (cytosine-5)-methyltransferase 1